MRMLVRREHSVFELTQKLTAKEFDTADIESVVDSLIEQNYQSDERFPLSLFRCVLIKAKGQSKYQ